MSEFTPLEHDLNRKALKKLETEGYSVTQKRDGSLEIEGPGSFHQIYTKSEKNPRRISAKSAEGSLFNQTADNVDSIGIESTGVMVYVNEKGLLDIKIGTGNVIQIQRSNDDIFIGHYTDNTPSPMRLTVTPPVEHEPSAGLYFDVIGSDKKEIHISGDNTKDIDAQGRKVVIDGDNRGNIKGAKEVIINGDNHATIEHSEEVTIAGDNHATIEGSKEVTIAGDNHATIEDSEEVAIAGNNTKPITVESIIISGTNYVGGDLRAKIVIIEGDNLHNNITAQSVSIGGHNTANITARYLTVSGRDTGTWTRTNSDESTTVEKTATEPEPEPKIRNDVTITLVPSGLSISVHQEYNNASNIVSIGNVRGVFSGANEGVQIGSNLSADQTLALEEIMRANNISSWSGTADQLRKINDALNEDDTNRVISILNQN